MAESQVNPIPPADVSPAPSSAVIPAVSTAGGIAPKKMDDIVALCRRRGFVFQSSEIYGGINGFWDYGPLGVLLKNNLRDAWWHDMVVDPPAGPDGSTLQIVGVDTSIIQHPQTWVASGHAGGFNDPRVDCRETQQRFRADHLFGHLIQVNDGGARFGLVVEAGPLAEGLRLDDPDQRALLREVLSKEAWKVVSRLQPGGFSYAGKPFVTFTEEERKLSYGPGATMPGTLTEARQFNLMFKSHVGAMEDAASEVYLRPETAQGIFLNFKNIIDTTRVKVPFGIAQVGKSFRNEVTPRNFIFRSREFEQMEMEWFCRPSDSLKWYEFWRNERLDWWTRIGVSRENLVLREHAKEELSHYSSATADIEYRYPFTAPGTGELEGIAHRGDYDLTQHQTHSNAKLDYFEQERNERYLPHVIEPASGLTRGLLVLICEAYTPDPSRPSGVYLGFHPRMAPLKAGVFPLVNKDGMPEIAEKLYLDLRKKYALEHDAKQSIGKRYARMDEAGTPFCFTVDGQTLQDQSVTVRHRDTQQQERVGLDKVGAFLAEKIGG